MDRFLKIEGMKVGFYVSDELYDDFVSQLNEMLLLFRLTDFEVKFASNGTRIECIHFKKYNELFSIYFTKNSEKKLNNISAHFIKSKKEKIKDLFLEDMDIDLGFKGQQIIVATRIKSGMLKMLEKLKQI